MISNEQYCKELLRLIEDKLRVAVTEGEAFYQQSEAFVSDTELGRVEFALGSRYLHRGFYCPSPDLECIISNVRRGKIVKRLTKASKPTNCYMFDEEDNLFLAETFYPNGASETEYILRKGNVMFGFTYSRDYGREGRLCCISVEEQHGQQKIYLLAHCYYLEDGYRFFDVKYESISAGDDGMETDICLISGLHHPIFIDRWKEAYRTDDNGNPILDSRELLLYDKCRVMPQEEQ